MERTGGTSVAVIVPTRELLKQMVCDKPPCWPWAAFASMLFQRWAAVEERKIRQVLGFPMPPSGRLQSDRDVALFVAHHIRAADDIVVEAQAFLSASAFSAAFGSPGDENSADADGIVWSANRMGDYYERLLELAEECRAYTVPEHHAELLRQCTQFLNQLLQDFAGVVNDVLERLEWMQNRIVLGQPPEPFEPVTLPITTDPQLIWAISDRLQAMNGDH